MKELRRLIEKSLYVSNLCAAGVGQNCGPILAMVSIVATLPLQ